MTARRDFLAFTAGAVVAKTVLPLAAKAKADALVWLYGGNADRMPYELRQEDVLFSLLRDITGRAKV